MGYKTRFELEIYRGDACIIECTESVIEQVGYDPFDEEHTWRNFEEDMKKVSKLYARAVFKISGEGGESGDLWEAYFKGGKVQKCKAKIVYDDFDEALLQ